ncbi:MAG: efflux RND transporter periplasmic adaptor subunit [Halothiobacillaceae bacterium]|nr:efflux RND transporter periplasmic adaptor subunit [Halothiobacillaceae bacterium]
MTSSPLLFIASLGAALILTGCKDSPVQTAEAATPASTTAPLSRDAAVVEPPPALRETLKVAPVEARITRDTQRVSGAVRLDERRVARIGSTVTGRVTSIRANVGERIQAGQVLATVSSTELAHAQLAYLKALSTHQLKQREAQRARALFESGVISEAEMQRRDNDFVEIGYDVSALADQLRVLGMNKTEIDALTRNRRIDSEAHIVSTQEGSLIERRISMGEVLQATEDAFTVADLSHVWVVAEPTEQDAAALRVGQDVEIEIPALGGQRLTGQLIFISDTVNPSTRTVTVRTDLDNSERRLKPDMLAVMLIHSPPQERRVVPARAVVRENNQEHVFVEEAPGRFRLTPVTLDTETADMRPILSGLRGDERIVVDGAFHLNNERRRQELE